MEQVQAKPSRWRRWKWLLVLAVVALLMLTGWAVLQHAWGPDIRFNSNVWRSLSKLGPGWGVPGDNRRTRMLNDLLSNHLRLGMTHRGVTGLLGQDVPGGNEEYYNLTFVPTRLQVGALLLAWSRSDAFLILTFNSFDPGKGELVSIQLGSPGHWRTYASMGPSADEYPWALAATSYEAMAWRFSPPEGFERVPVACRSWAEWLRHLPLESFGTPVRTRDEKTVVPADSPALAAVVDIDVRPNQECADTIVRLRAEYLRWAGREGEIVLNLTGGGTISWPEWKKGMRPRLEGNRVRFERAAGRDALRANFDRYLQAVFMWCGTYSLAQEGRRIAPADIRVGDFFAHGGSPGHAVLIVDLARDRSGKLKGLLLQGFMPAQSAHVLAPGRESPWFDLTPGQPVEIAGWSTFQWSELRRFARERG